MYRLAAWRTSRRALAGVALAAAAVFAAALYLGSAASRAAPLEDTYPAWESARLFEFPGEWSAVRPVTVRTIFPGQASWQWVTSAQHPGSASVQAGTACASCHGNAVVGASTVAGWAGPPADHRQSLGCQACHEVLEQRVERLGQKLIADPVLEDDPIPGKIPSLDVQVQAAFDADFMYFRFEWESSARPGILHDLLRWNGQKWENAGGPSPDAEHAGRKPSYEDRLTINVGDAGIPASTGAKASYGQAGCWIACHNSMRYMPLEPTVDQVKADPSLGDQGLKQSDVRKYLLISRAKLDETGGWNAIKPKEEVQRLLADEQFLDMWMWRGARSGPLGYADDNYVLDYRFADKGKTAFRTQTGDTMYDEQKMGYRALTEETLERELPRSPLIEGQNSAPVTPDTRFSVGDILPRRVLRPPEGSNADILANSRWANGRWVLEMRRKLDTGQPDDKLLQVGKTYTVGIAIFQDMVDARRHHVSFPLTLGLDTPADIVARPVDQLR